MSEINECSPEEFWADDTEQLHGYQLHPDQIIVRGTPEDLLLVVWSCGFGSGVTSFASGVAQAGDTSGMDPAVGQEIINITAPLVRRVQSALRGDPLFRTAVLNAIQDSLSGNAGPDEWMKVGLES